jgi:hypothetical protein
MNITHTITQLAAIQAAIDTHPTATPAEQIQVAGLEGLRADLINDLYAAAGNPEALPAVQERFAVRMFARRVAARLQEISDRTRNTAYQQGMTEARTALLDEAGQ